MYLLSIVSLCLSLVGLLATFYIFVRHARVAHTGPGVPIGHNAVIEPFLLLLEHRLVALQRYLAHYFYALVLSILSKALPLLRRFTHQTEAWLIRTVQMVRGKRELNYLGRKAASQHLQDMGDHQDEVRKEGGSIE